ncbi:MAG: DUF1794, partial [uncultured Blastococcus sp.]
DRAHRAAGARHLRRPQRPGGLRGTAVRAAPAGRVARRGPGHGCRWRPPVRSVDPLRPRRSRVPGVRGAQLAADRRRRHRRPARAGGRLLAAPRSGRRGTARRQPGRARRDLPRPRADDDQLGARHRRPGPHARRPRHHPGRAALRDRRGCPHVRHRPCWTRRGAPPVDVRPTGTDPM